MKILILTGALLLGATTFAQTAPKQPKYTVEQRAQMRTDSVSTAVGLNETQKASIYKVNLDAAKKREEIKNKPMTEAERKEANKSLHQETQTQYKSILTPEQYEKLKEVRKEKIYDRRQTKVDKMKQAPVASPQK